MFPVKWPRFDPIEVVRLMHDLGEGYEEDESDVPASLRYLQTAGSLTDKLSRGPDSLLYGTSSVSSEWKHHPDSSSSRAHHQNDEQGGSNGGHDRWATVQDKLDALDKLESEWHNAMSETRNFGYSWLVPLGKLQTREEDNESDAASSPRMSLVGAGSPQLFQDDPAAAAAAAERMARDGDDVAPNQGPVRDLDADIEDADARSRGSMLTSESDDDQEEDNDTRGRVDRRTPITTNNRQEGEESETSEQSGILVVEDTPEARAARARQNREEFLRVLDRRMRQGDENEASMNEDDDDDDDDNDLEQDMDQGSDESMEFA
ncbi:hypothetical protein OIV83_001837 [Microbotryomycetes sp. JL201]|nr:hypothetical protein OIV83_001837 [Microbotryomycetes sp. JL201]